MRAVDLDIERIASIPADSNTTANSDRLQVSISYPKYEAQICFRFFGYKNCNMREVAISRYSNSKCTSSRYFLFNTSLIFFAFLLKNHNVEVVADLKIDVL